MHRDEVPTDAELVRQLLRAQFPHWAELSIEPVPSAGTDNALYRLGDELLVRLPRRPGAATQADKDQEWLPKLAPHLPVPIPVPVGKGKPGEGYPWSWSVCPWLHGENPTAGAIEDPRGLVTDLASFVNALHAIDTTGGPPPGEHNFFRGVPLVERDGWTRAAISALEGEVDTDAITAAWEEALAAPAWTKPPVWVHGDLSPGNLLLVDGRVSGVIDFGCLGVGDPAVELIVAWNLLSAEVRDAFRAALDVDDATWARGRGWALSVALIQLPYYKDTNPPLAANSRHVIREILADG